jgi:glutathione peroxidase
MRRLCALLLLLATLAPPPARAAEAAPLLPTVELTLIDGERLDPASVRGKVVLIVNIASFCGYTGQLQDLQLLYRRYRDRGLVLLGVPSDQFGQEPGSDREIRNFCTTRYGVEFPLLAKQEVNGPNRSPLYRALVASPPGGGEDISWNFEKFLLDRKGKVIARFSPSTAPLQPQLVAAIEMALSGAP